MRNITSVLTKYGQQMFANVNGKSITFTRAVVGQSISQIPLEQCTTVTNYLKDIGIEDYKVEDDRFILHLNFNNRDIVDDTYIHQIGIYAQIDSNSEKLVQIIEGRIGDFVPNQTELFEKEYEVSIKFESSFADATINITYTGGGGQVTDIYWSDILGKPSTFPPSTHSHTVTWNSITGKPSTYPPSTHSHTVTWNSITEKPSTYPPSVHKHSIDDINFNEISRAQINSLF